MNPDQFHEPPEDVIKDQLRIEATPEQLEAEAEALAQKIRENAEKAADMAVKQRVTVSVTPRGRIRRNGPCPCGSGRKFKKCCLGEVKTGEKPLPSPKAMRAYIQQRKSN